MNGRRRLLLGLAAAGLAGIPGCSPVSTLQGSFLQLWRSHLDWTPAQWRERFEQTRRLGCRDLVIQWVGLEGGQSWRAPDALVALLFDEAQRCGMTVELGLPYDERWWKVLAAPDTQTLPQFLQASSEHGVAYMQSAAWSRHPAFRGWYIPYELEQYNWGTPERQALLIPWLESFASAAEEAPAISTYYSQLPSAGSLADLWRVILDGVAVRPMVQDGIGVAGMKNYAALEPLRKLLRQRGTPFDLIVELFEEIPSDKTDGSTFNARAADFPRVRAQLRRARSYGAQRVLAFAVDPWLIGDTLEAQQLLASWIGAYGFRDR